MKIVSFNPNENGSSLILELEDAENNDVLELWTDNTYKDYGKAIDLSDKLDGTSSQIIEITKDDLNSNILKGAYFVQTEDNLILATAITEYSVSYEECILNKLSELELCDECLKKESNFLINAQTLLLGFRYAVKVGFIEEAKNIRKALDKFCSNDCKTCGKYPHIINNNYYDYNS